MTVYAYSFWVNGERFRLEYAQAPADGWEATRRRLLNDLAALCARRWGPGALGHVSANECRWEAAGAAATAGMAG